MKDIGVMERMALANGAPNERNAREFLATTRESMGEAVVSPPFLHPPRWVLAGAPGDEPPAGRVGYLRGGIEEHWTPEYTWSRNGSSLLKGYWVTQRWMSSDCDCEHKKGVVFSDGQLIHPKCGRALESKHKTFEEFRDTILSLGLQVNEDAIYNGFYAGIPGNDPIHADWAKVAALTPNSSEKDKMEAWRGGTAMRSRSDWGNDKTNPQYLGKGQEMRGGTEISHGRREWREKTKPHVLWDPGCERDIDRVKARKAAKKKADIALLKEKVSAKLPRNLGEH